MASRAIASLDAWLARAEEVLAEQREHAISPSLGLCRDGNGEEWTIPLAAFSEGLEGLLEALCARPGRWILIVESVEDPHLFWQALAFEDGSLVTEVVSNHYLPEEHHWTRADEEQLLALGWKWHVRPYETNWINVQATTTPDIRSVTRQGLATLRKVFGLEDEDTVFVKMFSSTIRGDTPATPVWPDASDAGLIDPFNGPEEQDPDLHPDPSADDLPFGDEPVDDHDD